MSKITLIVGETTAGAVALAEGCNVIEKEVSDADSARLVAAYAVTYASKFVNSDGTPRTPTGPEVVRAWFDGIIAGSVAHVRNVEEELASRAAAGAVTPIEVT